MTRTTRASSLFFGRWYVSSYVISVFFDFKSRTNAGTSIGKLLPPSTHKWLFKRPMCESGAQHRNDVGVLPGRPRGCPQAPPKAEEEPVPTRRHLCTKITQVVLSLAYLLYDTISQSAPEPGTTALVVVACLPDHLLLGCESYNTTIHRPDTSHTV